MKDRQPRHAPPDTPTTAGRPARARRRLRAATAAALAVAALGAGAVVTANAQPSPARCTPHGPRLQVTVSPELVGAVQKVGAGASRTSACLPIVVRSAAAADSLAALAGDAGDRPDVWIPDSSTWLGRPAAVRAGLPSQGPSVARSPLVLAVPSATAARLHDAGQPLDLVRLLLTGPQAGLRLALPAPRTSAATVGAVLAVRTALADHPDARPLVTAAVRSAPAGLPPQPTRLMARLTADPALAVPVSEQAVAAYAATPGAVPVAAVPLPAAAMDLDYPFLVLTAEPSRREQAHRLLSALRSRAGQQVLVDEGFRDADGRAGTADDPGSAPRVPAPADVLDAVHFVDAVTRPARVLAVLDISGSMRQPVPGTGGMTRLEATVRAAGGGLALYPDDTDIGLWVFSTELSAGQDHAELVPVQRLDAVAGGRTARERLASALAAVRPLPSGGTGLYDTTLAAVRSMTRSYVAGRAHTVVLLSDGKNDDAQGIELQELTATLQREQDPERPVRVVTVALGRDSDTAALATLSRVTAGASYAASTPDEIRRVFFDAVGQRSCRPSC